MTQQIDRHPQFPYGPEGTAWTELLSSAHLGNGQDVISDPSTDPKDAYPVEDGFDFADFEIPPQGMTPEQRRRALTHLESFVVEKSRHMLGFQGNQDMDGCQQDLARFMEFHLNNVGDPFTLGNYKPHSKIFEQAILDYFASLWRAEWPHGNPAKHPDSYWGYVLTMGSTEGNLYGLYNARDYLSGKKLIVTPASVTDDAETLYVQAPLPADLPEDTTEEQKKNVYQPVVFYSQDTHYSIVKAVRTLGIDTFGALGNNRPEYQGKCPLGTKTWPMEVPSRNGSDGPGEIDVDALVKLVEFFAKNQHPIMLLLNFGTTFKGAYDHVREICDRLYPILRDNNLLSREIEFEKGKKDHRRGFWIHVDGALGAGYMPFLRYASEDPELRKELRKVTYDRIPEFDFSLRVDNTDMVSSIVTSGHKWPGSPWPCGVFMTKNKFRLDPPSIPEYTGTPDTTFAGSRNGLSAIVLWNDLARKSMKEHARSAVRCLAVTQYLETRLLELEEELRTKNLLLPGGLYVERSPLALTVRFRQPNTEIVKKWSLSCQPMTMNNGEKRRYAHVFAMPSLNEKKVDALIEELRAENAFAVVEQPEPLAAADVLAEGVQPIAAVALTGRGFS